VTVVINLVFILHVLGLALVLYFAIQHFAARVLLKFSSVQLGVTQIDPLLTKICTKNDFYTFVSSDLDL